VKSHQDSIFWAGLSYLEPLCAERLNGLTSRPVVHSRPCAFQQPLLEFMNGPELYGTHCDISRLASKLEVWFVVANSHPHLDDLKILTQL
jgi:hypothetical protein